MSNPPKVTFLGVRPSDRLTGTIVECARGLEKTHGALTDCRVRFEVPRPTRQICREMHVRLEVLTAGSRRIVVRHTAGTGPLARIAILQVFDAARRQLNEVSEPLAG